MAAWKQPHAWCSIPSVLPGWQLLSLTPCTPIHMVVIGGRLSLSWVQLHGALLLPPSSPSAAAGAPLLPLLEAFRAGTHEQDSSRSRHVEAQGGVARGAGGDAGVLHLEHVIVVSLCSSVRQWSQQPESQQQHWEKWEQQQAEGIHAIDLETVQVCKMLPNAF